MSALTLSVRIFSIKAFAPRAALFPSQVIVAAVTPIDADGTEDVNAREIFRRDGFVRDVRRDFNHLARFERQLLVADSEAQRPGDGVAELFAVVVMKRHHAALLHVYEGEGEFFAGEEFS